MRTDELIALLANNATPVAPHSARKRFRTALLLGGLGALALMLLGYGVRPDLGLAIADPMFWVKLAFPLGVAISALVLTSRLSHPGAHLGQVWMLLPLPWLAVAVLALFVAVNTPPADRLSLVLGRTWLSCAFSIALISTPVLAGVLWAVKGLAPTRPGLTGASAGLVSAAVGATIYALHCTEMQAPFLVIWYALGMLIPTAVGALLGVRLLRW